ncbi:MAG: hypothetical protein CFE45_00430 [Burkholderiales bacterium PBB5]|nr:MAG: hypothetical protein CFE45_00430 [Burkholderiales bacterium PBB5]
MNPQIAPTQRVASPAGTELPSAVRRFQHPLVSTNGLLIDQAVALAGCFADAPAAAYAANYAALVGPHLRHVVEHLDALLVGLKLGEVDYDRRPRDTALEHHPALAVQRLRVLRHALDGLTPPQLALPLTVHGQTGMAGEWGFASASSVGRELAFMASHTVHHFALLRAHCVQLGLPVPEDFGKAPATVAHARRPHPHPVQLS